MAKNTVLAKAEQNNINLTGGSNNMPKATDFNVGSNIKAARKLLMTFVDVNSLSDSETYDWELVGKGVEESAIELNPSTNSVTDICGITETEVDKWEPSQSFDPNTVRGGSKLNFLLHQIWQNKEKEKLSQFNVLIVYAYIDGGEAGSFEAEVQKGCTINITSIGGSTNVDMPIEISYSNDSTSGTVSIAKGVPTFTAAA